MSFDAAAAAAAATMLSLSSSIWLIWSSSSSSLSSAFARSSVDCWFNSGSTSESSTADAFVFPSFPPPPALPLLLLLLTFSLDPMADTAVAAATASTSPVLAPAIPPTLLFCPSVFIVACVSVSLCVCARLSPLAYVRPQTTDVRK